MNDSNSVRRQLVQKLESLQRAGVRGIPRPTIQPQAAPRAASAASPPASSSPKPDASRAPVPANPKSAAPSAATPAALRPSNSANGDARAFESDPLHADLRPSALQVLAEEVSGCALCAELAQKRTQTVFGVGNPNARILFFGEAPGADEDRQGEPFVGKAGQLLTKIIEACTLKREDVYIMNVLKCRPTNNRNPTPEEATNCRPFFEKQLDIIRPEMIVCLGSIAATTLLETKMSVGRLRGSFHDYRGIQVAVTYHPAYLLRNPDAKKMAWMDMKMVMKQLGIAL